MNKGQRLSKELNGVCADMQRECGTGKMGILTKFQMEAVSAIQTNPSDIHLFICPGKWLPPCGMDESWDQGENWTERERAELGSIPSRSSRSIKERKGWKSGAQDRNSSTWEVEAWGLLWVQGQPIWLPSQFQASERYIVRPWLKIWMNASKQERLYWTTLMRTLMYKCDDTCL